MVNKEITILNGREEITMDAAMFFDIIVLSVLFFGGYAGCWLSRRG